MCQAKPGGRRRQCIQPLSNIYEQVMTYLF